MDVPEGLVPRTTGVAAVFTVYISAVGSSEFLT